jgi:uncharacterized protein GlcG (DUF336 family)
MDGAPFVTSEVARGKAFAIVATGGVPGDELAKRYVENPQVWSNASSLGWGAPLLPSRGAYPVYIGGVLVGAVGASGAPSEMGEKAIILATSHARDARKAARAAETARLQEDAVRQSSVKNSLLGDGRFWRRRDREQDEEE